MERIHNMLMLAPILFWSSQDRGEEPQSVYFISRYYYYCTTLNICGIKFSRFTENDILARIILALIVYHGSG